MVFNPVNNETEGSNGLREFLTSRGAQMLARFGSKAIVGLATWAGVTPSTEDVNHTSVLIASVLIGALLHGADVLIHRIRENKLKAVAGNVAE